MDTAEKLDPFIPQHIKAYKLTNEDNSWVQVATCKECLTPSALVNNVSREPHEDGDGWKLTWSWAEYGLDPSHVCQKCGTRLRSLSTSNGKNTWSVHIVTARFHSNVIWWNPFTWGTGGYWELKDIENYIGRDKQ
jgi:hypothetical protein